MEVPNTFFCSYAKYVKLLAFHATQYLPSQCCYIQLGVLLGSKADKLTNLTLPSLYAVDNCVKQDNHVSSTTDNLITSLQLTAKQRILLTMLSGDVTATEPTRLVKMQISQLSLAT